jgi:hypothetical protein
MKRSVKRTMRRGRATKADTSPSPRAPFRYMTIVAQDPSVRHEGKILTAKVTIPAEDLLPGPIGYRVQVVDYDATKRVFHGSHNLPARYEDEPAFWRDGGERIVNDLRFHAQNAYALVMKTLARFEFALGRRLGWSFDNHQLKVAPHGMVDANAFYTPVEEGLVFGYFAGLSGARVYTCLSHDIVVHEATHALLDCLRERYLIPSNPDQGAFHEGFADVVALLSVFSLPEIVNHLIAPHADARGAASLIKREAVTVEALRQSALFGLAKQMGDEIEGLRGGALRRSAEISADPALLDTREYLEPHKRGELFVAAVINGFIAAWAARIANSAPPGQRAYPLARVVEEGADIADTLATMWIRAIDYMPPVHLEFGDALSAALTADTEVRPDDSRYELRAHMVKQFAAYGITPASARNEPTGIWAGPPSGLRYERVRFDSMRSDKDEVFRFLWDNRDKLELRDGAYTQVISVRPCVRTGPDGFVLRETVSEYYQVARMTPSELKTVKVQAPPEYLRSLEAARKARRARAAASAGDQQEAGLPVDEDEDITTPLYGGGVLLFDEYGHLKYWVHKDVFGARQASRLEYLWNEGLLDARETGARYRAARLSTIHRLRAVDGRRWPKEGW